MYQTPFADRIRNEVGIRTIAVGAISEADHANSIIAAGRADLCAVGRPHLADRPDAARGREPGSQRGRLAPRQYLSGRDQMYREALKKCGAGAPPVQRQQLQNNGEVRPAR